MLNKKWIWLEFPGGDFNLALKPDCYIVQTHVQHSGMQVKVARQPGIVCSTLHRFEVRNRH